jgi:hypothetical protein
MIQKTIFLALSLCLMINALNVNAAEFRPVGFGLNLNISQLLNAANLLLDARNPELSNMIKNVIAGLDNANGQANTYIALLNRTNPKLYNQLKQSVDLARAISGIDTTSLKTIALSIKDFPNDPVQLAARIASTVFAKELKQADAEVVRRLTVAINNIQDPKLKALANLVASNPVLIERVFGKGVTQEPVTRLVYFLARI